MAYLPGFSADIFISYSHVDNHHIDAKGTGWVDYFHSELHGLVDACVGQPVEIWRDPRLGGATVFPAELADRLNKTAILVAIVSPGYLKSDWCERERNIFVQAATRSGGLDIGNARRIVRAVKEPMPVEALPSLLQPTLGFPLYTIDEHSGEAVDYLFDPRPEAEKLYRRTLSQIARAIADLLSQMRRGASLSSGTPHSTVYLAETTSDLERERDAIRLELDRRGCLVVPREPLPRDAERCAETIRAELSRASLSVHLIGKRFGAILEGESRSVTEVQARLASQVASPNFRRALWIPPGLEPAEEAQRAFIERIRTQLATAERFDLLETPFEELKTYLLTALAKLAATDATKPPEKPSVVPQVYLVRDAKDRETAAPLDKFLFDQGFEVITPPDEGDPAELRENHKENLKVCDAVMIWWGSAQKAWLHYMMRDLDQAPGFGRTAPFRAKAVFIAAPPAHDKDDFRTQRAEVIRFIDGFTPELVAPLVAAIKSAARV